MSDNTLNPIESKNWFERLQFYTKDFNKKQNILLARHIKWVKAEGIIQEGNEIEKLIEKHFDGKKSQ